MPGCAALGCSNRTETGYSLKSFPRDPERRALWTMMVNRKNWIPKNSSYICEIHFDDNQWEIPRVDGKKKLKANAVPTIFDFSIKKKPYSRKKERKNFNGKGSRYEEGDIKGQLPLNGLECLVCHSILPSDGKICADSITATTGVTMKQRLRQITNAVSHKWWKIRRKGSLCRRCAQLINYVDKMESELALLKSALADCILVKGDRHELTEEFVTNLLVLDEFQSRLPELGLDEERGDCLENQECLYQQNTGRSPGEEISAVDGNNGKQLELEISMNRMEQVYQCKICLLKTNSQSVLLFHLRRHMANYQWCDFCDIPVTSTEDSS